MSLWVHERENVYRLSHRSVKNWQHECGRERCWPKMFGQPDLLVCTRSTTPHDQMSARLSTRLPLACSGDMYAAVPMTVPATVAPRVTARRVFRVQPGCVWRFAERLRQSEVEQLHYSLQRDLHVGWLQSTNPRTSDAPLVQSSAIPTNAPTTRNRLRCSVVNDNGRYVVRLSGHSKANTEMNPGTTL